MRERPGIHKSALTEHLGMGWGTINHHVKVMVEARQLRATKDKREVRLFPIDVPPENVRWLTSLCEPTALLIVEELRESPRSRLKDLTDKVGVPRKVVRRHLGRLQEAGLVRSERKHHPVYSLRKHLPALVAATAEPPLPEQPQGDVPALAEPQVVLVPRLAPRTP